MLRALVTPLRDHILGIEDGSEIEKETIVFDPSDNRRIGAAESFGDPLSTHAVAPNRNHLRRDFLRRKRAASDLRSGILEDEMKLFAQSPLKIGKQFFPHFLDFF
jgi:hypothetical protein